MIIREPVVAGQFYPVNPDQCRKELTALLEAASPVHRTDERLVGGLVPHAGWICSGAVAARVFTALASSWTPDVIVMFSGVHQYRGKHAAMFGQGRWESPLGPIDIDGRLAERILGHTSLIIDDPFAHEGEHSLEVQMPFIATLFPGVKVIPIAVPITQRAPEVGEAVGRTLKAYDYDAMVVGTTDLTHYGPRYGFMPHGVGDGAIRWAKEDNDRRFIDLICDMKADQLVAEAAAHHNACNAGAAAATITAAMALGAESGVLLEHTTSAEVLTGKVPGEQNDSVGYAGVVFS